MKRKRKMYFSREMIAQKEAHVKERVLSELGSRHRVKRKDIIFKEIREIKPKEVQSLEIRRALGIESEF